MESQYVLYVYSDSGIYYLFFFFWGGGDLILVNARYSIFTRILHGR